MVKCAFRTTKKSGGKRFKFLAVKTQGEESGSGLKKKPGAESGFATLLGGVGRKNQTDQ
jgi:hypothetical protein